MQITENQFLLEFGHFVFHLVGAEKSVELKFNHVLNAIASVILGWYDLLEKISAVHKSQKNACRALHRLVEEAGVSLPAVLITIKRRRPLGEFEAWWPFFL